MTTCASSRARNPRGQCILQGRAGGVFTLFLSGARGESLVGAYNDLDLVPKGRDEAELPWAMARGRHHDRYRDGARPGSLPE